MSSKETVWRIRNWHVNFEISQGRRVRNHSWFAMSNRLDSDEHTAIKARENGAAHFGIWVCLLQVASSCQPRGLLVRCNGAPHDVTSISRITSISVDLIKEVIPRLVEIGCLEVMDLNAVEKLIDVPRSVVEPPKPIPAELAAVLKKLGISPADQQAIHGKLAKIAAEFGGPAKLAAGLESAIEADCTDLNSATACLRELGWLDARRKAKDADPGPEIIRMSERH